MIWWLICDWSRIYHSTIFIYMFFCCSIIKNTTSVHDLNLFMSTKLNRKLKIKKKLHWTSVLDNMRKGKKNHNWTDTCQWLTFLFFSHTRIYWLRFGFWTLNQTEPPFSILFFSLKIEPNQLIFRNPFFDSIWFLQFGCALPNKYINDALAYKWHQNPDQIRLIIRKIKDIFWITCNFSKA